MTRIVFAAALALAATLPTMPAQAGASRTFVSAAGSDSNPCTITLPCRNFAAAYMQTGPNGQVDALDPGNYGSLTITGPVSIEGHGWASMSATTGAAITINANTSDKINIVGVVLDGLGIVDNTGIQFNSGGSLIVRDSVIRNFYEDGIFFVPNSSGASYIFVSNTLVSGNRGYGIAIFPDGSGTTAGVLNHVELINNGDAGLNVGSGGQTIKVTVSDSVSAFNVNDGIDAGVTGGAVTVVVRNSTVANNGHNGLSANVPTGAGVATILVTRSTITGNGAAGWNIIPPGVVVSYGDNNIDGNGGTNPNPAPPCVNGTSPCSAYK
jgi:hypothetical protein